MGRLEKRKRQGQVAISSGVVLLYIVLPGGSTKKVGKWRRRSGWRIFVGSYVRPVIIVGPSDCAQTKPPVRGDNRFSLFDLT